jgi:hypothetical protein
MSASLIRPKSKPPSLQGVRSLRSSLVLGVWGEPGVGKTHWVESFLREAAITQLRVSARSTVSLLAQQIPSIKPRPVWLERRLEAVFKGRFDQIKDLAELIAAMLALNAPIALHVEDLHTADIENIAFWSALGDFVKRSKGVALITTGRSEPPAAFQAWRLEPLTQPASEALLTATLGTALPIEASLWFWVQSQGNVLFTLEYLRVATRRGWLWSDGLGWRWRTPNDPQLPTSLEGLLIQLFESAAEIPDVTVLLEARAVLPEVILPDVWRAATGLDQARFAAALSVLERHGIIVRGGFPHQLYRDVLRQRLEAARVKTLARPAFELLLKRDDPSARAQAVKLLEYVQPPSGAAFDLLVKAADDALKSGDALQAALLEAHAVAFALTQNQAEIALRAAKALRAVRPNEALRLVQIARHHQPNIETTFLTIELLLLTGEAEAADALVKTLDKQAFELEWLPRFIAMRVQQLDFASALELWASHTALHRHASALLRRDVAWSMIQFGDLDTAQDLLQAALSTHPDEHERGALLMALAYLHLVSGELSQAENFAAQSVALLEPQAASIDLARALEVQAEVLENQGFSLRAAELSTRAVALRNELGDAWGVCRAQLRLASALLELAEYERSEQLLLESRLILERRDAFEALIVWDCQLAHLYAEWNPAHGASLALRHARDALRRARERRHPTMLNTALAQAAWVEAWYGVPSLALALSEEALGIAAELGVSDQTGLETMARGAALEGLGRLEEARDAYRNAILQLRLAGLSSAERYALELDRLDNDAPSAAKRIQIFEARGQRHAIRLAKRYFPQLQAAPETLAGEVVPELQVLGSLRVVRGNQVLRLQTRSGKDLLALLLEARLEGRNEIPDLELMDRLLSDQTEHQARNALKNLVYRLRTLLGAATINRTPTGYALGTISSDAERFLESGDLKIWRSAYLEDSGFESSNETRDRLIYALQIAAQTQLELSPALVVRAGRILVSMEPYDLTALRLSLQALRASNNRRDLASGYEAARLRFAEVSTELPASWQDFLQQP